MTGEQAIAAAREWIRADPDPDTRAELQALVDAGDENALIELMAGSISFGTAGLRAAVGPGPLRMNRAVVRRTTAGVARYVQEKGRGKPPRPVVVAADARLSSPAFMKETVGVLAAHGLPVRFFTRPAATPLAAYVARRLEASACIIITASHNPKADNGYKLYADNAVQIVPPVDVEVAAEIARSAPANQERMLEGALEGGSPLVEAVDDALIDAYFADVQSLRPPGSPCRDLRIAYTPLHGIGYEPVRRALSEAGFDELHVVASQREPDGNFPTVRFPNPEEPGALDAVTALAAEVDADIVIANDPDVDRLAASLKSPAGQWVALSGNQIGVLLADHCLESAPREPRRLVAQSIVSSPMLRSIADAHGAEFVQTLTGFKWIWTAALDRMATGEANYVFGYEEALGYSAGHLVRDKDGVSAAVLLCELAAAEKSRGSTLRKRLETLYRRHGLWVSTQASAVRRGIRGAKDIARAMEKLGTHPPSQILGEPVTGLRDFRRGGQNRPRWLENTSLVELSLGEAGRILVRPSGTEPKLKCYVDLRSELQPQEDVWQAESDVLLRAERLAQAMLNDLGLGETPH